MKIIVLSAHPDDAETGTGGLCARASNAGHEVLIVHLSREVRNNKINGISEAKIRTLEGKKAAKILGVQVEFLDYYMGEFSATVESSKVIEDIIRKNKPDIVLTQWPVDSHPDHQVVGILPIRPYIWHQKFCIGFYEVYTGIQTISFQPNRYVDISGFVEQKRKSILAHKSQNPERQVEMHEKMSVYRGLETGCEHAEAFHILGRGTKTAFDELFDDTRYYKQSGGMKALGFPKCTE